MPDQAAQSQMQPSKKVEESAQVSSETFVTPGMPPLEFGKRRVSMFEFWPVWVMYIPVVIQWLLLSIRHRSLTLPLLANPGLQLSGMVGVAKSELYQQANGRCADAILTWFTHKINHESWAAQANAVEMEITRHGLSYPVVCKPDVGCRGSGVKLIKNTDQLQNYLSAYPIDSSIMIQRLAENEAEAGVFYVREPDSQEAKIVSLALKYMPYVVGNGVDTLGELVANDERAGQLKHLYQARHQNRWHDVIAKDEPYRLVFSATHSKGAIFKDANQHITPQLTTAINDILLDLPEFHYGRLDIKFPDIENLKLGKGIEIIEINTASSESLHIWDSETTLKQAVDALLYQYRVLFRLGCKNRKRGYKTPSLRQFLHHWLQERRMKEFYPETD